MKLRELFEENSNDKLVLPDFQRALEWKIDNQKRMLASFFVGLPIGSLLILKGNKDDFAAKKLCFPKGQVEPKEDCLYLLDGQQRISSLKSIFSDFFNDPTTWLQNWEEIYNDLQYRWFVRIKPQDGDEDDVFGWGNLQFKGLKKCEPAQVLNYFETRKIFKTKTAEWHNPGFSPKDESGNILRTNARKNYIAKLAAEEALVPLYTVFNNLNQKPLHTFVLEKIATIRIEELKAEVEDGIKSIEDLLESVEPDIKEIVNSGEKQGEVDAWSRLGAKWSESINNYLNSLLEQDIPIIELPSDEISRAVSIFENINRGGTPLDTYDLIVAKAARNRNLASLTQRIIAVLEKEIKPSEALLQNIKGPKPETWNSEVMDTVIDKNVVKTVKNQFLNLISIYSYSKFGDVDQVKLDNIKRNAILELNHKQINDNADIIITAIVRACSFLQYRCGILKINALPYELMILPISYLLIDDDTWNNNSSLSKIEYWYWSSLFGGAYRERQNERCIRDLRDLYNWIHGGENKFKTWFNEVLNNKGYSSLDVLLLKDENHDVPSAIHKGILQYILSKQPKDFLIIRDRDEQSRLNTWEIVGATIGVEDHHIIPLSNATKIGESTKELRKDKKHLLNSPLNRTYISSTANQLISDESPAEYLEQISELAQWGHFLPTPIKEQFRKRDHESNDQYYERVLNGRYHELVKEIKTELEELEGI